MRGGEEADQRRGGGAQGVPDCGGRAGLHGDLAISVGWRMAVSVTSRSQYLSSQAMIR